MEFTALKKIGKCCISGKPLADSANVNLVGTKYIAEWEFPTSGNILNGECGLAVAIVHDDMIDSETMICKGDIKEVIEFTKDDKLVYHPVTELKIMVDPILN